MQGNVEILDYLNHLISGEMAARDQYFIHSRMYDEWGYTKLYEAMDHEMVHETEHASAMIKRVLMLSGTPAHTPHPLNLGTDVQSMLENDLALEYKVRDDLKKGIALCEQHQDYVTRNILVEQLKDTEEDHAHWLEQQLRHIKEMGLENYLQSQR